MSKRRTAFHKERDVIKDAKVIREGGGEKRSFSKQNFLPRLKWILQYLFYAINRCHVSSSFQASYARRFQLVWAGFQLSSKSTSWNAQTHLQIETQVIKKATRKTAVSLHSRKIQTVAIFVAKFHIKTLDPKPLELWYSTEVGLDRKVTGWPGQKIETIYQTEQENIPNLKEIARLVLVALWNPNFFLVNRVNKHQFSQKLERKIPMWSPWGMLAKAGKPFLRASKQSEGMVRYNKDEM